MGMAAFETGPLAKCMWGHLLETQSLLLWNFIGYLYEESSNKA